MRDRLPLIAVGALLLVGVLGSFLVGGARRGAFADRLSTYRSAPDGTRALYVLLESSLAPKRWQREFEDLPAGQTLVILGARFEGESAPVEQPDGGFDEELTDDDKADLKERGLQALRTPQVSSEESERLLQHVREGGTVVYVPWHTEQNSFLSALGVYLQRPVGSTHIRTLVPAQPTPYTHGVEHAEAEVSAFLEEVPPDAVHLLIDEQSEALIAAVVPYGQGKVIVIASAQLAMNRAIGWADNAQLWRSLLRAAAGKGPVAFDEFHHGFTSERSMGEFAARSGLHIAVGQLLLGVILWAASLRLFGRPREPVTAARVGSTDALSATSRLYREGRHFGHAASSIVRQLASECAERAGVAAHSAPTDVSAALELRGRKDLATALLSVARAASNVQSDTELQTVARLAALTRLKLHSPRA